MLWDVPILFVAFVEKSAENLAVLEKLLASPLAIFLELGADQLLTGYLGGGVGPSSVFLGKEKQKRKEVTVKGDGRESPLFVETDGYR